MSERTKCVAELDKIFSLYVRAANPAECYTCGAHTDLCCGHYMGRKSFATRWLFENAKPQCYVCNGYNGGEPEIFRANLVKELGEEKVQDIERLSKSTAKFSVTELKILTARFITKMKLL